MKIAQNIFDQLDRRLKSAYKKEQSGVRGQGVGGQGVRGQGVRGEGREGAQKKQMSNKGPSDNQTHTQPSTVWKFLNRCLKLCRSCSLSAQFEFTSRKGICWPVFSIKLRINTHIIIIILLYTLCTCEVWLSQCSSYRMDSVPCTVPAAHNYQLRTSETQRNNTTIKHAAHTMRERKREEKRRERGRKGREAEREGRREGRREGEGGRERMEERREGGREGGIEGGTFIHTQYIYTYTHLHRAYAYTHMYIDCSCKLASKTLSACISWPCYSWHTVGWGSLSWQSGSTGFQLEPPTAWQ